MSEQVKVKKSKSEKNQSVSPNPLMPWDGMDDDAMRLKAYNLQLPASLYEKMRYINENAPGGMSMRIQILNALVPFVDGKLQELKARH